LHSGGRAGCADLLRAVQGRVKPSFCVYGHIHEDTGVSLGGVTHFINAASVDGDYRCGSQGPLVFDLPKQK